MGIGKKIRLSRLFGHPSGRLCSVAVDHYINYAEGIPAGLADIRRTLAEVVEAGPDAVTMHRGIAASAWAPHAGRVPLILQSSICRPDDSVEEQMIDAEDAIRMGADAIAVAAFLRGPSEGKHLRFVADCVRDAARFDLPVIAHVYPRRFEPRVEVSFAPDDIAWAVRCAMECGVDVVKTPYCGEVAAYAQIVRECTVPLVAAGGPKTETLADALTMFDAVVQSGALGATVGRNAWGFGRITQTVRAMKAVIHDGQSPANALAMTGE